MTVNTWYIKSAILRGPLGIDAAPWWVPFLFNMTGKDRIEWIFVFFLFYILEQFDISNFPNMNLYIYGVYMVSIIFHEQ